jgi:predicted nucleic acid-binding protein
MKKTKIYLDTSVVSYLYQLDAPEKMQETLEFWEEIKANKYETYMSSLTMTEINKCSNDKLQVILSHLQEIDYTILPVTEESEILAEKIIDAGVLTRKSYEDCIHIACASIADCDYILSWNFKHLVKIKTINGVRAVNCLCGYSPINICSPNMLTDFD